MKTGVDALGAAVILGAGFSKNSGIPVQAEIPSLLIKENGENSFEDAVSLLLKDFISDIFCSNDYCSEELVLPELDDVFSCIDISTNSGHHLGIKYSPLELRAIRRFLVYRLFSILHKSYFPSESIKVLLERLASRFETVSYVLMNWDMVLERYIIDLFPNESIDYCNGSVVWESGNMEISRSSIEVAKLHGSSNWLYCDNCRSLFHDLYDTVPIIKRAGISKNDIEMFRYFAEIDLNESLLYRKKCPVCRNEVFSHIATFSYRKSFRANSFPNIWSKAEEILSQSDRWIFIGYSLPEADYEFKHLLKISELKLDHVREKELKIDLILLNASDTIEKYRKFFGRRLNLICNEGVDEYLAKYIND